MQTQTLNFRPSLVPPKIKVIRTVDGKNRARIHTEFLELVTVHGSYHLIVGRYNIPSDVDRDIDSHVIEVEREVLADITIPAPTLERVVVEMAAAVAEAKRRRSEIDGDNPQDPRE